MGNTRILTTDQGHTHRSRPRARRLILLLCLAMTVVTLNSGCLYRLRNIGSNIGSHAYANWRNFVWAKRAYQMQYGSCDLPCADDFRDGFIAGYCNICDGNDGYVPALPPEKYWDARFQNVEGQKRTKMWFAGFPAGVKAARDTGAGAFTEIPISNMLEQAIQNENKAGKDGIANTPQKAAAKDADYSSQPIPVFEVEWDKSLER